MGYVTKHKLSLTVNIGKVKKKDIYNAGKLTNVAMLPTWAEARQNQQNDPYAQWRLRSAWASAQSGQSSLSPWRNIGPLSTYWTHGEDSDQTGQMPRQIGVFAGRTLFCWFCCAAAHFSSIIILHKSYMAGLGLEHIEPQKATTISDLQEHILLVF